MSFKAVAAITARQYTPLTRRLTIKARGKLPAQTNDAGSSSSIDGRREAADAPTDYADGLERKPYTPQELRLVKRYLRAAIHGHSPAWKRLGWKPSKSLRRDRPDRPDLYLSKRLLTEETTTRKPDDPPHQSLFKRAAHRQPWRLCSDGTWRRPLDLLRSQNRSYATTAAIGFSSNDVTPEMLESDDVLSGEAEEDVGDLPEPPDLAADEPLASSTSAQPPQALKIGDIVQIIS